jgi:hypothetical protein
MDRFEDQLRKALRREEPDGDFSARVLARVAEKGGDVPRWRLRLPRLQWVLAMAMFAAVLGLALYRHEQQRRETEGKAARQQVLVALRIAGTKIRLAQAKVQEMSQP